MNDLITNGEAKTNEPKNSLSLDTIESTLSYFIGKLVEHHIQRAMIDLKMGEPIDITPERLTYLEKQVKILNENVVYADTVNELIKERLDERDAKDAEDLADAVRQEISNLPDSIRDVMTDSVRDIVTNDLTFNVDVS